MDDCRETIVAMPSTLVTGGSGFIGSHVADALIAAGHRVVAFDDLTGGFRENVNPAAEFVEGSILDLLLKRAAPKIKELRQFFLITKSV